MRIVEIAPLSNGAHRNQSGSTTTIPEGWAAIPEGLETENFPFGTVIAEEIEGYMVVTSWIPGVIPPPEPVPPTPPETTIADIEAALCDMDEANEAAHVEMEIALCDIDEQLNGGDA